MVKSIKVDIGMVIEDLQDLSDQISDLENLSINEIHNEVLRIRRNINETIVSELVLLLEDGENHEREKVES